MLIRSLGWEDPLEEGMATHSSIPAWRIPRTERPGGLQSMGSQSQTRLKLLSMHVLMLIMLPEHFEVYYTFLFAIAKHSSEIYLPAFERMFKYLE